MGSLGRGPRCIGLSSALDAHLFRPMTTADATLEISDGIGWITLARPSRGNALSGDLVEGLLAHLTRCVTDPLMHTVVFVGAGKHFCTGFDLEQLEQTTDAELLHRLIRIETLLDAVWRAPVRTVAIAQGRVLGAGADLWVACDQRVLAPEATVRFPGAGFGIVLGTRRLGLRVGTERALQWTSAGTSVDSTLALQSGLATSVAATAPPSSASGEAGSHALAPHGEPYTWRLALLAPPPSVDRATYAALKAASRGGDGFGASTDSDHDLAALVRSAARPGLKTRLLAYRDRSRQR
ncbi:MAG: enoyl-CoA hydratase/isomerase family protein [Betaproteobacteria bacterium]|nr:enoyl-CoA hydratase/isomerase family protein [Betaproteobacteria bacterium]